MKLLILPLLLLSLSAIAQPNSPHDAALARFQKYYNAGQGDSINAMFGHSWDQTKTIRPLWTNKEAAEMLEEFGTLQSFRYIGIDETDPQKVHVYQTVFSKAGAKTTSCTLDKENAFSTFRFITTSKGISKLVKKANKLTSE